MKRLVLKVFIVLFLGSSVLCTAVVAGSRGIAVRLPSDSGRKEALYKGSYALVLGNSGYRAGMDPLPGVLRDVKDVATALQRNGFDVTVKTNLTRSDFQRAFESFALRYGTDPDNRLLFYYAGHGHTEQTATGDAVGYLVMVDSPLPTRDRLGFRLASLDMQYFITQAKLIQAKHVLFLFDSCFSGTILNFRATLRPEAVNDAVRYPVRQFITAGRANEPVPDQSVFKQAFVDILEGRVREPIEDGYLTGEELGLYLKTTVPVYSPMQNPQYGKIRDIKLDKGDFVFVIDTKGKYAAKGDADSQQPIPDPEEERITQQGLQDQQAMLAETKRQLAALQAEIAKMKSEKQKQQPARPPPRTAPKTANEPVAEFKKESPWQGVWEISSTGSSGQLRRWHLLQEGDRVRSKTGTGITLKGRIKNNRLVATLILTSGLLSSVTATMAPDGNSFKGHSSYNATGYNIRARRIK